MDKFLSFWYECQPREQLIIAIGGGVFILFVFFMLIVSPLLNWQADERKRLENSQEDLVEVKQLASRLKTQASQNKGKQNDQSLSVLIDRSLQENQLVMRGFQPGSKNDARLRLENAAYSSLVQWLYDLEYRHGVSIQELSLTPAKTSGRLMVSLRVSK